MAKISHFQIIGIEETAHMTTTNMIEAFEEGQQESLTEGLQSGPERSEIWSPKRSDAMIIVKTLSRVDDLDFKGDPRQRT